MISILVGQAEVKVLGTALLIFEGNSARKAELADRAGEGVVVPVCRWVAVDYLGLELLFHDVSLFEAE